MSVLKTEHVRVTPKDNTVRGLWWFFIPLAIVTVAASIVCGRSRCLPRTICTPIGLVQFSCTHLEPMGVCHSHFLLMALFPTTGLAFLMGGPHIWSTLQIKQPQLVEWCHTMADNARESCMRTRAFHLKYLRAFYAANNPSILPAVEDLYDERGPHIWNALDKKYPGKVKYFIGWALLERFRHEESAWVHSRRNIWITACTIGGTASGGRRSTRR